MKHKIISISALTLLVCLLLTSCSEKISHTGESFKSELSKSQLSIVDKTNEWSATYKNVATAYSAKSAAGTYELLFFSFESAPDARVAFDKMTQSFADSADFKSGSNFESCTKTTNDNYFYVSRVGESILKVDVKAVYKSEVSEYIKDLGYN